MTGKVWVLGDDIDTDIIIPTEYLAMKTIDDMKQYGFSPLRPELAGQIQKGDIIVAGKNFGCGSSREQAPEIIKALGIQCVIAKSFARIFFRNSINNGLLLIEQQSNAETRTAFRQSYHTHLMDLNLLCGIDNTDDVALTEECLSVLSHPVGERSLFSEQYRLDSLNVAASLHSFNLQYKPRLDLFVNGGMQTGDFAGWYRHFGWSAGIIFSWTIFDGRQKRWKERQVQLQQSSIQNYKSHAEYQRGMRISQCLSELAGYDERGKSLNKQLSEYEHVLSGYEKEMQAGQVSVLDYITVLRNKIQTERDYLLLQTNRQLVIAAYNYWNW